MVVFVCVVLVLLVGTKTKQRIIRRFFCIVVCKNQKLYFSESFRSMGSFDPSCFFLMSFFLDGTSAAATTTTMTQNNTATPTQLSTSFRFFSSLTFAGLVVVLIFLCFRTEFVFTVCRDWREVLCLVYIKIEPKRQGFTLPLGRISLSCFQPNVNFPSLFLNLNRFPLFDVACILRFCYSSCLSGCECVSFWLGYVLLAHSK